MKFSSRKIGNITFTNVEILLIIGSIILIPFFFYILYRTFNSERNLFSLTIIPLLLGVIFENIRLSNDWKSLYLKMLGALMLSVFAFMPNKQEFDYNFENQIEIWPYFFIFFFVLISVVDHSEKVTTKLTEGITLLQSISIIYLVIDLKLINLNNPFSLFLIGIGLFLSLYSILYAFSYLELSKSARLILSIWSSITMLFFSINYLYRIYNSKFEIQTNTFDNIINLIQYFLLGISLMYIFQNVFMLMVYLPSKNSFYSKNHINEIKKMNKIHIERYSKNQIKVSESIIALILSTFLYLINYKVNFIKSYTLIWMVFWIFPLLINLKNIFINKNKNYPQHQL